MWRIGIVIGLGACGRFGFERNEGGPLDAPADGVNCPAQPRPDRAAWPMPNDPNSQLANLQSYEVSADLLVVQDKITGLVWQRDVPATTYTQDQAIAYCGDLVLAGECDWRLPTRIELLSIADYEAANPAIDAAFGTTPNEEFWSAAKVANLPAMGWRTSFASGLTDYADITILQRARCVRGGAMPPATQFELSATSARDTATGLIWQRVSDANTYMWSAATAFCDSLTLDGAVWHAPSIRELESIVDTTRTAPALDATAFAGEPGTAYWSRNLIWTDTSQGWGVIFDTGVQYRSVTMALRVRCVR